MAQNANSDQCVSPQWREVLQQLAGDIDELVADFSGRLSQLEGGYSRVDDADIQATAHSTLSYLLALLMGNKIPDELVDLPRQIGIKRARQKVPREQLLEAVRFDYPVLWGGLVKRIGSSNPALLVANAEKILEAVEDYAQQVQKAFLTEQDTLRENMQRSETRALLTLLASEEPESAAAEFAEQQQLPLHGSYELIVIGHDYVTTARARIRPLQQTRQRFMLCDWRDGVVLVRQIPASQQQPHLLADVGGVLITDIAGLAGLPPAAKLARSLIPFATSPKLCTEHDLWLQAAAGAINQHAPGVIGNVLRSLENLPEGERARLLETFLHYCETGSVKAVAAESYVHRNTVLNRLRAFRDHTGLDPTVPVDAARALLSLKG